MIRALLGLVFGLCGGILGIAWWLIKVWLAVAAGVIAFLIFW